MRFVLLAIFCVILSCNTKEQNLDISVSGKVSNESGEGVSNVEIYISRGKIGHYAATRYSDYKTIRTNSKGEFHYIVEDDGYVYRICCGLPSDYKVVTPSCKKIDHSIINGRTNHNTINFTLKK